MRWLIWMLFAFPVHASSLWLAVGEVRSLPAPSGQAVRVGTKGVIKVIDGDTQVKVVALKPGTAPVVIGEKSYLVHVALSSQREFVAELSAELSHLRGLQLATDEKIPVVRGLLLRFSDWERIAEIAERLQGQYRFEAQALPEVAGEALSRFRRLAAENGFPIARFRSSPQFTVQVPQADGPALELAQQVLQPYGIQVRATESALMIQPLIRTRVVLAELSRSDAVDFGIEWPNEFHASLLPSFKPGTDLMVSLHALEAKGRAQILASPNLICRSGGEAKFHSGGSFPIKMFSRFTHDVIWKEHGVILNVKPRADDQGAISLDIQTEVSQLDMANAVDKIPALKTNSVESHFDLPGKRTISLSGLLRQESSEVQDGIPLLGDIPLLGALFSTEHVEKRQTELVIFVTPEIYTPDSDENMQMPKGWIRDAIE